MRLLVDIQGAQSESRFRGIGRYTTGLVRAIAALLADSRDDELWILVNDRLDEAAAAVRDQLAGLVPAERIRGFDVPVSIAAQHHDDASDGRLATAIREAAVATLNPDVVLVTSLSEGYIDECVTSTGPDGPKCVVVLYDLIPLAQPDDYLADPRVRRWYDGKLRQLSGADLLLAISEQSRSEALRLTDIPGERITTIGAALDDRFFVPFVAHDSLERTLQSLAIDRPFLLYVGGFDRRKNLDALVESYARLPAELRDAHQLVLAGRVPGGFEARLRHIAGHHGVAAHEIVFTDYVDDDDLVLLYRAARLLVFPSTREGFGFPVLEALACGTAVLAARSPCIEELVRDDESLYTHGSDDLTRRLARRLADLDASSTSQMQFDAHRDDFRWPAVAERAITAIRALCAEPVAPTESGQSDPSTDPRRTGETASRPPLVQVAREWARIRRPTNALLADAALAVARATAPPERPRLLVDVTSIALEDLRTGIQRVVRAILIELLKLSPRGLDVVPVRADVERQVYHRASAYLEHLFGRDAPPDDEDDVIDVCPGDAFLGLDLAHAATFMIRWFRDQKARGLHVSFVAYDLLPVLQPQFFPPGSAGIFGTWLETICKLGDAIYCISDSVADELLAWLDRGQPIRTKPLLVASFRLGADLHASAPTRGLPDTAEAVLAMAQTRNTFLMVGTIEPRKGHAQVVAAFDTLWAAGHDVGLVIVGKPGWLPDEFFDRLRAHAEAGRRLVWLERISDEYLEAMYRASTALIAASEGEGFGLPLIEGAQHHLPIIARDIPVFREVAGTHAFYFHGTAPTHLSNAVLRWIGLHEAGQAPASEGIEATSWAESGRQLAGCIDCSRPLREWRSTSAIAPGERLSFDSLKLDYEGWSFIEPTHRWNDGRVARIGFRLPIRSRWNGRVAIEMGTFGEQEIAISHRGRVLYHAHREMQGETIEITLPREELRVGQQTWIDFRFPGASFPNLADRRLLAVRLLSTTID